MGGVDQVDATLGKVNVVRTDFGLSHQARVNACECALAPLGVMVSAFPPLCILATLIAAMYTGKSL